MELFNNNNNNINNYIYFFFRPLLVIFNHCVRLVGDEDENGKLKVQEVNTSHEKIYAFRHNWTNPKKFVLR